jgi:hypothetical protein
MNKIVLDDVLRSKLNGLDAQVEVCDELGKTVGRFLPEKEYMRLLYAIANEQTSDEELERISREPGGRPLAEIWKSLGRT